MKYSLVLIALLGTQALKITQKRGGPNGGPDGDHSGDEGDFSGDDERPEGPSAEEIFNHCNTDTTDDLTITEALDCVANSDMPEGHKQKVSGWLENNWEDYTVNGEANADDVHEMMEAMHEARRAHEEEKKNGGQALAQDDGDHGEMPQDHGEKPPRPEGPPSVDDIMKHCNTDGEAGLTFDEFQKCTRAYMNEQVDEMMKMMKENWVWIAGEDGTLNHEELAMMVGQGPDHHDDTTQ